MLKKKTLALTLAAALTVPAALAIPAMAAGDEAAPVVATPAAVAGAASTTIAAQYPNTVPTVTKASVPSVAYGKTSKVTVKVSAGTGTPTGSVKIAFNGKSYVRALSAGKVSLSLGTLNKGSYTVKVNYTPTKGSEFKASSASATAKVTSAPSKVTIKSASVVKGKTPSVRIVPSKAGKAVVTITGPSGFKVTKTVSVKANTTNVVSFGTKVKKTGTYKVTVKLTPSNKNYSTSTASKSVKAS